MIQDWYKRGILKSEKEDTLLANMLLFPSSLVMVAFGRLPVWLLSRREPRSINLYLFGL